jgi:hypothetical protein
MVLHITKVGGSGKIAKSVCLGQNLQMSSLGRDDRGQLGTKNNNGG